MHTKPLPNNLGCHCGVGQPSGSIAFFPFQSLFKFKLPKISPKFMFTAALKVTDWFPWLLCRTDKDDKRVDGLFSIEIIDCKADTT